MAHIMKRIVMHHRRVSTWNGMALYNSAMPGWKAGRTCRNGRKQGGYLWTVKDSVYRHHCLPTEMQYKLNRVAP